MKLLAKNFNIAYGENDNGLTVESNDKFFNLEQNMLVNVIAGNCFTDWDDEDTEDFDVIYDLIMSFVENNHESNKISMWFD
mgnify:CR=1 FL=1